MFAGLAHFAVMDSEGERHIVVISEPLRIAAPQDDPTAAETASQAASRDSGAFEDSQPSHRDQCFIERQYRLPDAGARSVGCRCRWVGT